jgi:RNA polymerase sigma-70 factor (ECF subfamily)
MTLSRPEKERTAAESFDTFVETNFPPVYRFAFCMSLAPEAAARLTNAAFAQARRAQQDGIHPALNKQWLLTTVHHDWLDGRGKRSAAAQDGSAALTQTLLEAQHVAEFDEAIVLEIVHGMKEQLRLVLSLFYFEKLSYGEIAVILELPPTTVLSHLAEAKIVLRQQLEQRRITNQSPPRPRVSEAIDSPGG